MSDTASWFARKLGLPQQQPQQQPQAYAQPPQQPYPQQQPVQYQQQPQQPPQQVEVDANGNPVIHVMDAAAAWQGTHKARADSGICPECGSQNYFKRETMRMKRVRGGAHPSPICMDCGYNEIFESQYGAATPLDNEAPVVGTSPMIDTWNRK